ncbi:MAG: hypothetical protein ABGY24_09440, partial [bacterium]
MVSSLSPAAPVAVCPGRTLPEKWSPSGGDVAAVTDCGEFSVNSVNSGLAATSPRNPNFPPVRGICLTLGVPSTIDHRPGLNTA